MPRHKQGKYSQITASIILTEQYICPIITKWQQHYVYQGTELLKTIELPIRSFFSSKALLHDCLVTISILGEGTIAGPTIWTPIWTLLWTPIWTLLWTLLFRLAPQYKSVLYNYVAYLYHIIWVCSFFEQKLQTGHSLNKIPIPWPGTLPPSPMGLTLIGALHDQGFLVFLEGHIIFLYVVVIQDKVCTALTFFLRFVCWLSVEHKPLTRCR